MAEYKYLWSPTKPTFILNTLSVRLAFYVCFFFSFTILCFMLIKPTVIRKMEQIRLMIKV